MQFKLAGITNWLLVLLFLSAPLAGAEYKEYNDTPHVAPPVAPAVGVTARPGTTGTKADTLPNATGWDEVPLGDTAVNRPNTGTYDPKKTPRGPDFFRKIRVFARTLKPPTGHVFAQYTEGNKNWYDSIPGDTDGFPTSDFSPPGMNSIAVYRVFLNTKVPDANNFPWRLEGNLAGGAGGGQSHWGAKVSKPGLPSDLTFVFSDRPKSGAKIYVAIFVLPNQAILDGLANGGYIIIMRTQKYTRDGHEVTEVVYYGGKIPANLDPNNNTYYQFDGEVGDLSGGPHMMSDGRIALSYDVLINNRIDMGEESLTSPTSVAIEVKVFAGNPGGAFGAAVNAVPQGDRGRNGKPDENEYQHKANAYFGIEREDTPNPNRKTLWDGVAGSTLLNPNPTTCSFDLQDTLGYTSTGIQDPPGDINSRVTRPVNSGSGRYDSASVIPRN